MNNICTLIIICSISFSAHGALRNYETTRLKSTAGTGVGSILLEEATVLNPAPMAFFKTASIYLQKSNGDLELNTTNSINPTYPKIAQSGSQAIIISDSKGQLNGSLSYQKIEERFDHRKKIAFALSSTISKKSALGFSLARVEDYESEDGYNSKEEKYFQQSIGVIHSLSPSFSIGLTALDPFSKKRKTNIAKVGFQYTYQSFISLMGDIGSDYYQDLSNNLVYNVAAQIMIYDDFFLRFGHFNDKGLRERGNGGGVSWVQPKLSFDVAIKNIKRDDYPEISQSGDLIRETSFSMSYRW